MRLMTKTHGIMPTREEFDWLWEAVDANEGFRDGKFHFGNDPRLGTCALTQNELWNALQKAHHEVCAAYAESEAEFGEPAEQTDDWLSSVLGCLGLEWI
jgi:hypothetical protein